MAQIKATKDFIKDLKKSGLEDKFAQAANKSLEGVRDIDKKSGFDNLYSLRLDASNRALMVKDSAGDMVPVFAGSHAEYDKMLKKPPSAFDPEKIAHKIENVTFKKITGDFNRVGELGGMRTTGRVANNLVGEIAERAGMVGGIAAGAYTLLSGGSAKAAMENIVPGASSAIATMDGREFEAFLRGIEEIPLGFAATEFIRPLARAVHDDADIDPGLLEQVADTVYNQLSTSRDSDPAAREQFIARTQDSTSPELLT